MEVVVITSGGHEGRLYNVVDVQEHYDWVRFKDIDDNIIATFFKPNLVGWVYVDNNKIFKE